MTMWTFVQILFLVLVSLSSFPSIVVGTEQQIGDTAVTAAEIPSRTASADTWFQWLDRNHDERIDRGEYQQGWTRMQQAFSLGGTTTSDLSWAFWWPWTSSKDRGFVPAPADIAQLHSSWFSLVGFWKAFTSSAAMILATEIGDKTFFIAAVLSMKHDRSAVFGGAITALIIMTILSTAMGLVLPAVIPRQYTHVLGGILFLYFGCKLLNDSRSMEAGKASEELEEVEEELLQQANKKADEEQGGGSGGSSSNTHTLVKSPPASRGVMSNRSTSSTLSGNHIPVSSTTTTTTTATTSPSSSSVSLSSSAYRHWYRVFVQALTLTFLAEWGDRSQIATIALAAAKNPVGVTIGGCLGHCVCTGLAVLGGRMLAARISEKSVSVWGGMIFLFFGLHSIFLEE